MESLQRRGQVCVLVALGNINFGFPGRAVNEAIGNKTKGAWVIDWEADAVTEPLRPAFFNLFVVLVWLLCCTQPCSGLTPGSLLRANS